MLGKRQVENSEILKVGERHRLESVYDQSRRPACDKSMDSDRLGMLAQIIGPAAASMSELERVSPYS